ncbi:MAG: cupin domain-containing protein [Candidatus Saccharimonadales bacterium]|jgi:mannose-6-phosphate isomerase-like protein (cupin superfamily)
MNDYFHDLKGEALTNNYFRHVIETGENMQVVLMSIAPGEEIGMEVHPDNEQFLLSVAGQGKVILNGVAAEFNEGDMVLVKAGVKHNFITVGNEPMKIITLYSPPHHAPGTIHKTKAEADASE